MTQRSQARGGRPIKVTGSPVSSVARALATLPIAPVLLRIDTASMREIAQRGRKVRREASWSPEAQAYLNALEYWYERPENSAAQEKGR